MVKSSYIDINCYIHCDINCILYIWKRQGEPFIDLSLFSNNVYIGTTLANLMVNMDIGSLALFNIYVQDDKHLSAAQAGLITIPYMLCSLLMIRIGERFMQKEDRNCHWC